MIDLSQLTFTDATPEQFREFWEGEGWSVVFDDEDMHDQAYRHTLYGFMFEVQLDGDSVVHSDPSGCEFVQLIRPGSHTFAEARDALNELAGTKIVGGWME